MVKIQPEDITRLQEMKNTSPLAGAALQLMQQRTHAIAHTHTHTHNEYLG